MKIKSIIIENDDIYVSFQNAVMSTLIGYGKMYELLHAQLYRKGRIYYEGDTFTYNGRPVKAIKLWNIKSASVSPYDRDDVNNLGLNQLFNNQSPYDNYVGDPKDGIYHDDCYIQPQAQDIDASNGRYGWRVRGSGIDDDLDTFLEYDEFGGKLIDSIESVLSGNNYILDLTINYTNGTVVTKHYDYSPSGSGDDAVYGNTLSCIYANLTWMNSSGYIWGGYLPYAVLTDDLQNNHGNIAQEFYSTTRIPALSTTILMSKEVTCKVLVFEDGLAIKIIPAYMKPKRTGDMTTYIYQPPSVMTLPLCYMDDGSLVQNRIDFVDMWDELFELYVHEDDYWYTPVVSIVVILVSFVIGLYTGGAGLAFFSFVGAIGAVTGNKVFSAIGIIGSIYFAIQEVGKQAIIEAGKQAGFSGFQATSVAMQTTFTQQFSSFISTVGFSNLSQFTNLVNMGGSVYNLYGTLTTPVTQATTQEQDTNKDDGMSVYVLDDGPDDYVSRVINKVKI